MQQRLDLAGVEDNQQAADDRIAGRIANRGCHLDKPPVIPWKRVGKQSLAGFSAPGQLKPGEAQQALTAGGAWNVTVGKQMHRLDAGQ